LSKERTMMTAAQDHDPGVNSPPILHEDDIGSGERSPGQQETDQMIKEIPPLSGTTPDEGDQAGEPTKH
jgi:hypothetical protein